MSIDVNEYLDGLERALAITIDRTRAELRMAEKTDYLGVLYLTDYVVEGRDFPLDMLRYAASWPKHEADAGAIANVLRYPTDEYGDSRKMQVTLTKHHRDRTPNLCDARWESMGWKIISRETTRL